MHFFFWYFLLLWLVIIISFLTDSYYLFAHVFLGCCPSGGVIVWLPQRQWSEVTTRDTNYSDVITSTMASQITSLTIIYSIVYSGADQRKHESSASLAFVRGFHRWPVNSPHKGPETRKMFPFDDVIMLMVTSLRYASHKNTTEQKKTRAVCTIFMCCAHKTHPS